MFRDTLLKHFTSFFSTNESLGLFGFLCYCDQFTEQNNVHLSEEYLMVSVPLSLVSVDGDPVGEQLLQSSEGQVQRGSVPGAGGNHYRGTGKRCSVILSPTELFFY